MHDRMDSTAMEPTVTSMTAAHSSGWQIQGDHESW